MRVESFELHFKSNKTYVTTQIAYLAVVPKLEKMSPQECMDLLSLAQQGPQNSPLPATLQARLSSNVKRPIINNATGNFLREEYRQLVLWHEEKKAPEEKNNSNENVGKKGFVCVNGFGF